MTRPDFTRDRLIVADCRDSVASRAFFDLLFPNYEEERAKRVQETIDFCIHLIGEGKDSWHGIGPWYFDQARKQIAEGQFTECRGDPLKGIAA